MQWLAHPKPTYKGQPMRNNIQILKTCPPPQKPLGIKIQTASELISQLKFKDKVL